MGQNESRMEGKTSHKSKINHNSGNGNLQTKGNKVSPSHTGPHREQNSPERKQDHAEILLNSSSSSKIDREGTHDVQWHKISCQTSDRIKTDEQVQFTVQEDFLEIADESKKSKNETLTKDINPAPLWYPSDPLIQFSTEPKIINQTIENIYSPQDPKKGGTVSSKYVYEKNDVLTQMNTNETPLKKTVPSGNHFLQSTSTAKHLSEPVRNEDLLDKSIPSEAIGGVIPSEKELKEQNNSTLLSPLLEMGVIVSSNPKINISKKTTQDINAPQDLKGGITDSSNFGNEKNNMFTQLKTPMKKTVPSGNPFLQSASPAINLLRPFRNEDLFDSKIPSEAVMNFKASEKDLKEQNNSTVSHPLLEMGMDVTSNPKINNDQHFADHPHATYLPKSYNTTSDESAERVSRINVPLTQPLVPNKVLNPLSLETNYDSLLCDMKSKSISSNLAGVETLNKSDNVTQTLKQVEMLAETLSGVPSSKNQEIDCWNLQKRSIQKSNFFQKCIIKINNIQVNDKDSVSLLQQEIVNNLKQIENFTSVLKSCPLLNAEIYTVCESIKGNLFTLMTNYETSKICNTITYAHPPGTFVFNKNFENSYSDFTNLRERYAQGSSDDATLCKNTALLNLDDTETNSKVNESKTNTTPLNLFKSLLGELPGDLIDQKENISLKNTVLFCRVCERSVTFTLHNLVEHLRGENHQAQLLSLEQLPTVVKAERLMSNEEHPTVVKAERLMSNEEHPTVVKTEGRMSYEEHPTVLKKERLMSQEEHPTVVKTERHKSYENVSTSLCNATSSKEANLVVSPEETFPEVNKLPLIHGNLIEIVYESLKKDLSFNMSLYICMLCGFYENNIEKALNHVSTYHKSEEMSSWFFCETCPMNMYGRDNHFKEHCLTVQHLDIAKLRKLTMSDESTKSYTVDEEFDRVSVCSSKSDISNKSRQRLKPHEILLSIVKDNQNRDINSGPVGLYCQPCNRYSLYSAANDAMMNSHLLSEKHIQSLNSKQKQKYKKTSCFTCHIDLFGNNEIEKEHNNLPLHKELASIALQKNTVKVKETNRSEPYFTLNVEDPHYNLLKIVLKKHLGCESKDVFFGFYCCLCKLYFLGEKEWKCHIGCASHGNRINSAEFVGRNLLHDCEVCNIRLICDDKSFVMHQQSFGHRAIERIPAKNVVDFCGKAEKNPTEISEFDEDSSEDESSNSDTNNELEDNDSEEIKEIRNVKQQQATGKHEGRVNSVFKCNKKGVYLKGLPRNVDAEDIDKVFKNFGLIKTTKVNLARGIAEVLFKKRVDATSVLNKKTVFIRRVPVTVEPLMVKNTSKRARKGRVFLPSNVAAVLTSQNNFVATVGGLQKEMAQVFVINKDKAGVIRRDLMATTPGCQVLFFGSQVTGLATRRSDFDIYIDIDGKSFYSDLSRECQARFIEDLLYKSSQRGSMFVVKDTIMDARVPIIRMVHTPTNTLCDISCRSGLSVENSKLVRLYLDFDPRVRWLVVAVKWWMQANGLLDRQIFTSYATVWLVLFFLMIMPNPVICPLTYLQKNSRQYNIAMWDCRYRRDINQTFISSNRQSTVELLTQFFLVYGNFEFKEMVLCPLNGRTLVRSCFKTLDLPKEFRPYIDKLKMQNGSEALKIQTPVCLQDPFDLSHNITKGVSRKDLQRFKKLCYKSFDICRNWFPQ